MSLWKIALRSIQQRSLASALTGLSMALGVALVAAVLVIHAVVDRSFRRGAQGYDLIVGPKGSPLQLVLNTVYHLSEPVGRIPYQRYLDLQNRRLKLPDGSLAPPFAHVIPMCMGGNYRGYRVVGTTPEFFELEYHSGEFYEFTAHGGQGQNMDVAGEYQAVIGSAVARATGLKVGDTFRPVHGLDSESGEKHCPFTVVGIFAPTGTPNDRVLFINIDGFYLMHHQPHPDGDDDHAAGDEKAPQSKAAAGASGQGRTGSGNAPGAKGVETEPAEREPAGKAEPVLHAGDIPTEEKKVSAILVSMEGFDPGTAMAVAPVINDMPDIQAVQPAREISTLLDTMVGNIQLVLLVLAFLVVVVAGIGILVSIYNSMNDRRHEIAVMRALGASRLTVMLVILMESILLSLGGGAVGLLLAHGLIGLLAPLINQELGVAIGALQFQFSELVLIPMLVVLASVVGYLPAVSAYRTDVAKSLAST